KRPGTSPCPGSVRHPPPSGTGLADGWLTTEAFAAGRRAVLRKKQTVVEPSAGRERSEWATRKAEPIADPEPAQPSPNVAYRATTATVPPNRASQVRRPPKARALYGTSRAVRSARHCGSPYEPARLKRC